DWDHIPCRLADISRAKEELDYQPKVEMAEGLARTWDWLKERLDRN
ncbi:MAG: hypothetical protein JRC92_11680, partial [Deltaproteobacteria bacterium]|nr:hypothetical protein [Deltaproteobacteria bacterium]